MVGTVFATEDFVAVNRAGGSDFYVFATLESGEDAVLRLQRKARQVEESLRGSLDEAFGARIHKRIGVFVGHALLRPNPQMRVERLVYRALRQAIAVATTKEEERQSHPARELPRHPAEAADPDASISPSSSSSTSTSSATRR